MMNWNCSSCHTPNRNQARYCKQCGTAAPATADDPLEGLVGMVEVRQKLTRLRSAMKVSQQQGHRYQDRLHAIVIGNAGTGKTTLVHALAKLFHQAGITTSSTPVVCDAVDFAKFVGDIQENFTKAKGHVLCIDNVQKLTPKGYAEQVELIDRLLYEMTKPGNRHDPIVILSGQPHGLREYLGANHSTTGQFPHTFRLGDFSPNDLCEMTHRELKKSGFDLSPSARDRLVKAFTLMVKNSRMPDAEPEARNGWAALKVAETLKVNHLVGAHATEGRTIEEDDVTYAIENDESLADVLAELDQFIGMTELKRALHELVGEVEMQAVKEQAGFGAAKPIAFHVVLTGNPGTGKTTVARVLGRIFRAIGVLELGHVIEVDRAKMVGGYVGHTAKQVNDLCDRAQGGILFVDEAYALKQSDADSFGQEAIDTLLKRMEDGRGQFIVIVAGYVNEMRRLLDSNPGLQSRFDSRYRFHLADYTPSELQAIFVNLARRSRYVVEPAAADLARKHFVQRCAAKDKAFGNGREARTLFEACQSRQSQRIRRIGVDASKPEDLVRIEASDVEGDGTQLRDAAVVLADIDKLVGLSSVKRELQTLIQLQQVAKARAERGGQPSRPNLHFIFRGSPGTGKTTVAQLLADVFNGIGVLPKATLVEVDRSGLVGNVLGDTEKKTNDAVDSAMGGVLFVDEAYALVGDSFGQVAINTLLKRMDADRGGFILIAAGYHREMDAFLDSNAGLRSRFTKFIDFEDYQPHELAAIYRSMAAQRRLTLSASADERLVDLFVAMYASRDESFANGRTVRNVFEKTLENQAMRVGPSLQSGTADEALLSTIESEDVPADF